MSLQAMVYVIYRSKARGITKYVQLLIADYVDAETGQAGPPGPSLDTLAANGGIGKATAHRQVEKLTTLGELLVTRGGPAEGNANVYVFPRFRDEQAQRTGADRPRNPGGDGPERTVRRPPRRTADGPQTDRSVGRYIDDPYPDPSSGTGPSVTHPESGPGRAQGRQRPRSKQPRTPRSPDDPRVIAKAEEIRARQGSAAAGRYTRTVAEAWGRHQAGVALTQHLAGDIGAMPDG